MRTSYPDRNLSYTSRDILAIVGIKNRIISFYPKQVFQTYKATDIKTHLEKCAVTKQLCASITKTKPFPALEFPVK